ncbi:MAG: hypothetical protein ACT4PV_15175 [Planctomycetaceae bacterium]
MALHSFRRTQRGTVILAALLGGAILGGAAALLAGTPFGAAAVAAILLLTALLFGSLTVEVDAERVRIRFGPGLVRASWALAEVEDAQVVRNRWWHGWGIHRFASGWVFNVSGFDAVELRLRGGRRVRIGSDRPAELRAAVREAAGLG